MVTSTYRAGSGDPLLLLHGFTLSHHVWHRVVDDLAADYDVLALTMPGHWGGPRLRWRDLGIAGIADGIERELDAIGWDTCHVAGNSLGGQVAFELARRGRASSVAGVNPGGGWKRFSSTEFRTGAGFVLQFPLMALARVLGDRAAASRFFQRPVIANCSHDVSAVDPEDATNTIRAVSHCAVYLPILLAQRQILLVDAFVALLHGESALPCTCAKADCPKRGAASMPSRRKPLVQITVDIATLLGLTASPAHLDGHGPIDPALAQMLAEDATWQAMLTEMVDLATELGLTAGPDAELDPEQAGRGGPADEADEVAPRRQGLQVFRARGSRHRGGGVPRSLPRQGPRSGPPPCGAGRTISAMEKALDADPAMRDGRRQNGHGGLTTPPDGALSYRPDAATAAMVRTRDAHCRFPGCSVPAARCQLDHVVPFSHRDPESGGWTIVSNLQCLCQFHHNLKTMSRVGAAMLGGGVLAWTSRYGTTTVTLPGGAVARVTSGTLVPRLTRRRERRRITVDYCGEEPPPF
ncbi:alpha/beta hydrolase family protein [Rhodococcus sp. OK519]|nr:alpha/beta hydrolase family protein [Rhodococcus sp. OK519]